MVLDLEKIEEDFDRIQRLCVAKFVSAPAEKYSYLFPLIVNKCEVFLKKYSAGFFQDNDDFFADIKKMYDDDFEEIRDEILRAYGPVWMKEFSYKDDLYFLTQKQVTLQEWNDCHSPYEDLQRVACGFYDCKGIADKDIALFFKNVEILLTTEMPLDELEKQINLLFSTYHIYLSKKY